MLQISQTQQHTNILGAMESRDHLKNGASLKSRMSRGNFFRKMTFLICFLTAVLFAQAQQEIREEIRRHIIQAQTAYNRGNFNDALKEYEKAQALAPQYPELYKAIGDVYEKLGGTADLTEAIAHFTRYLELAPDAEDSRAIQDKIYALQYLAKESGDIDRFLDDLSGTWVAMDNLEIINTDTKTGQISYIADFIFEISEIQKTGKYRITIVEKGSRYYGESIIRKTVDIVPQKDKSFNFTFADAQVHTPNQGGYSAARLGAGLLANLTGMSWLGDAGNVAIDIKQSGDLPNNTQTAYIFALKYRDGKLEGLVNVVQDFANPNQQRTLKNDLYEITFVKKNEEFINEIRNAMDNKPDIFLLKPPSSKYFDKWGNKLSNRELKNKLMNGDPELGKKYQRAKNQEAVGIVIAFAGEAVMAAGVAMAIIAKENKQQENTGWYIAGAGLGSTLLIGLPIGLPGTFKAKKIIEKYNDQVTRQSQSKPTSQLYFGITSSGGIGLTLNF